MENFIFFAVIALLKRRFFFSVNKVLAYHIIHKNFFLTYGNYLSVQILDNAKNLSHHALNRPFFTQHDLPAVLRIFFYIIIYRISCLFCFICWCLWLITNHININFSCVIAEEVIKIWQYKTFISKSSFILTTKLWDKKHKLCHLFLW